MLRRRDKLVMAAYNGDGLVALTAEAALDAFVSDVTAHPVAALGELRVRGRRRQCTFRRYG